MEKVAEYQGRMRQLGLMTMGYEFTTALLQDLGLHLDGMEPWEPSKDTECQGWIINSSRTICARKYTVEVAALGAPSTEEDTAHRHELVDKGTTFVSGFSYADDDASGPFVATSL